MTLADLLKLANETLAAENKGNGWWVVRAETLARAVSNLLTADECGWERPEVVDYRSALGDEMLVIPTAPECVERPNRLVAETGAKVVISSSWRNFASWYSLAPALAARGFVGEVIGETPNLVNEPGWLERWRTREGAPFAYERLERGWEIREWIAAHDVTAFTILDDCSDMAELKPWLVHTDAEIGLDDPDVERAKWLLDNSAKGVELARSLAIGGCVTTTPHREGKEGE